MTKHKLLLLIIILFGTTVFNAEAKLKELNLTIEDSSVFVDNNNLYSHILLIDDRADIEKKELKIDEENINEILKGLLPASSSDKTLMIQVCRLYLFKENGKNHYYIQARAYEKNNNKSHSFFWINTLNESFFNQFTDEEVNSKLSTLLVNFIKEQLSESPESYSPEFETSDFKNIPDLEKQYMYVYQIDELTDGIYASYASFVDQKPDKEISNMKFKKDQLKDVYYQSQDKNKDSKVQEGTIFGVVVEGDLFIHYGNKYIRMFRDFDYNDFYFYSSKQSGSSIGVSFGLIGALLIPSTTTEEKSLIVLDHLTGELKLWSKNVKKQRKMYLKKIRKKK